MRISARLDTRFRKYDMTACVSTTTYISSESKWVSCVACAVKAWFHLQWCTVFLGLQGKKLERMQSVNQPILWGEELLELDMDKFLMLLLTLNYPEQHVGFFSVLLLVMPFESLILYRLCLGVFSLGWCAENPPLTQGQGLISYYHPHFLPLKSNVARQRHLAELYSNQSCD